MYQSLLIKSNGFEQIVDFLNAHPIKYALKVNPTIYTACIEQFWATKKVKTVNGEVQIQALVDKKKVIITETSVRSDLQFKDDEGTECLPNAIIFEQLTLMGAKTTAWNEFSSSMASAVIVTLVDETQGRNDEEMFDTCILDGEEVFAEQDVVEKETLIEIKAAKPKDVTTAATTTTTTVTRPNARGVIVQEPSEFTTTTSPLQPSQLSQAKDKGKAKMVEPEKPLKKKDQIMFD
ncbi:hypothetical protein Tco_0766155 [Tanacetum coccineum]